MERMSDPKFDVEARVQLEIVDPTVKDPGESSALVENAHFKEVTLKKAMSKALRVLEKDLDVGIIPISPRWGGRC